MTFEAPICHWHRHFWVWKSNSKILQLTIRWDFCKINFVDIHDEEEKSSYQQWVNFRKNIKGCSHTPCCHEQSISAELLIKQRAEAIKKAFFKNCKPFVLHSCTFFSECDKYGLIPIHHRKFCILSAQKASNYWFWWILSSNFSDDV